MANLIELKVLNLEKENHELKQLMMMVKENLEALKVDREQPQNRQRVRGRAAEQIPVEKVDLLIDYNKLRNNCINQLQNILNLRDSNFIFNQMRYTVLISSRNLLMSFTVF